MLRACDVVSNVGMLFKELSVGLGRRLMIFDCEEYFESFAQDHTIGAAVRAVNDGIVENIR